MISTNRLVLGAALSSALTLACSSVPEADDEAGVTTSPGSDPTDADANASDESSTTTGDEDPTLGTSSSTTDSSDATFLDTFDSWDGDWGGDISCDAFAQDCPEGEKCVPYASGGETWDALKCVPVQGEQGFGDPCMYAGVVEGFDDCDAVGLCWNADANGIGTCHPFCAGSPDAPECPPMSQCLISNEGVINVCVSDCDPVVQNCVEGQACYFNGASFSCYVTSEDIPAGEPCGFVNDCALGNICVDATTLPNCAGSACCTSYCEVGFDEQCAALPGTSCVAFYPLGEAPAGYEHVGICILPP